MEIEGGGGGNPRGGESEEAGWGGTGAARMSA